VRQGERAAAGDARDLTLAGLAAELEPALEEHPEPGGADGMAEGLEAAVGIDGQLAIQVEGAGEDFLPGGAASPAAGPAMNERALTYRGRSV
jgi:hypothetical protein